MTTFNRLNTTDEVMATLEAQGSIVASVQKRNFATVDDVVRFVLSLAGKFMGLGKLTIRNKTQGWNMVMSLAMRRPVLTPAIPATNSMSMPPHSGRQYLIPW